MRGKSLCHRLPLMLLALALAATPAEQTDDNYVRKALDDSTFTWLSSSSDGIRIYYPKGSFAERHRMMLLRSVETAVDEVLELLGKPAYEPVLNVFYLDSREEMKQIVGKPYSGFADWGSNAMFVVVNPEWRSFEKHEFTHVVTMGVWGEPDESSRWMIEGISIYSDGWCREYSVDEIAYHFLLNDQLPALQELFDDYAALGEIRAGFAAASLIGYIRNTYGMPGVRALWLGGTEDLKKTLGDAPPEIEKAWKLYLERNVRKDVRVDLDTIKKRGCG